MLLKKIILFGIIGIVFQSGLFAQCSACKATVESQIQNGSMTPNGINDGILYLMIIPYVLMLAVGYVVYKNYRKFKESNVS